jgi:hypothetical protein
MIKLKRKQTLRINVIELQRRNWDCCNVSSALACSCRFMVRFLQAVKAGCCRVSLPSQATTTNCLPCKTQSGTRLYSIGIRAAYIDIIVSLLLRILHAYQPRFRPILHYPPSPQRKLQQATRTNYQAFHALRTTQLMKLICHMFRKLLSRKSRRLNALELCSNRLLTRSVINTYTNAVHAIFLSLPYLSPIRKITIKKKLDYITEPKIQL